MPACKGEIMYPTAFRSTLLLGAALAALTPAAVAAQDEILADDTTTAAPEEQNSNDIIVTARRRSESAQDIPLAVTVIGGPQIAETGAFNVGRLQQLAPTLQFTSSNPRNTTLNIRGLGVPFGLTSDGFEQGVGLYIDDVYYARVASAAFDFLDVAQVEVLRGPQGTLYGKNTAAGAVSITTNQPTFDFEGSAEISLGNYEFKQARVAVAGPLSDTIAVRIAASATDRHGTIRNVTSGQNIQSLGNLGLRAQLLGRLAPGERQKVIAVVSPRADPGKSFVATNLAAALCQLQNVCLVDLDLRNPAIGTLLGAPDCAGVNAVLRGARAIADIGCVAEAGRLVVLPAREAAADATRLLASDALPNLFDALRREPDTISIVDAPAILAMDDAILITRHVDGVIVVVEEGRTTARDVRETLRLLRPAPLIGTVLNRSLGGGV